MHLGATAIRDVALYAALAMLALWPISAGLLRYRVRRVFGADPSDPLALDAVRRKLDQIHAYSPSPVFGAERVTSMSLAGHNVVLVYGLVGFGHALRGDTAKRVYTIAEGGEIEWMQRFPDVFDRAVATPKAAVFWVRMPALMHLTRRCS